MLGQYQKIKNEMDRQMVQANYILDVERDIEEKGFTVTLLFDSYDIGEVTGAITQGLAAFGKPDIIFINKKHTAENIIEIVESVARPMKDDRFGHVYGFQFKAFPTEHALKIIKHNKDFILYPNNRYVEMKIE